MTQKYTYKANQEQAQRPAFPQIENRVARQPIGLLDGEKLQKKLLPCVHLFKQKIQNPQKKSKTLSALL